MNIAELDSYNLADAVKFNKVLNPRIWSADEHLRPQVHERLLAIAEDFREFLGVQDLDLQDITISGSNAAYTYTPNSDIDLHLVVNMPDDEVYRELFDAKKFQYNEQHNIRIGGADVELYVQTTDQPHISQGIYSVLRNEWIQVPRRARSVVDDTSTRNKFEKVGRQIEHAVKSGNLDRITRLADKIKRMRQTGLESHGEFGPENLAFKMLRAQGMIKQLFDARNAAKDRVFSIQEKVADKPRVTYGFKTPDAPVAPVQVEAVEASIVASDEQILKDFVNFCVKELKIKQMPVVKLRRDPQWSVVNKTFGRYINDIKTLEVAFGQRHIMDVLRTVAHELTHKHQHERESMPVDAGETGSVYENEANARAGVLMRDYGRLHPELFDHSDAVNESKEFCWSDYHELPMEAIMDVAETYFTKNKNLLESNNPGSVAYFTDLFDLGVDPQVGSTYLMTMLMLVNDRVAVAQSPVDVKVIKQTAPGEYSVQLPDGNVVAYPFDIVRDKIVYHTFFFAHNSQYEKLKLAIKLKFDAELTESASGYIPTKKQARDPRYSMALTQDIKPGQLGKEANKLKLKTNSQGAPQIAKPNGLFEKLSLELAQFKQKGTLIAESGQLDEVRMAPSNLAQFAASPEAEGIQAGFEAELIFRDTTSDEDDDDGDQEPDMNMDERTSSISQIIEFFTGGDYGISSRQAARLEEQLNEQYYEWSDSKRFSAWQDDQDDVVRKAWLQERPMADRIHDALVDGLELSDRQADAVEKVADLATAGLKGSEMTEAQLDMFIQYKEAKSTANDVLDEDVATSIEKQDKIYEQAQEEFNWVWSMDDDSGFFEDQGLNYMSDVSSEFDLDWPYMTSVGGSNGGSRDWQSIGASLKGIIDMPVTVSSGYHQAQRRPGVWIVEPDSSLKPDDSDDYGLEIVSPPMPLLQALDKLKEVTDWANDSSEGNAYTNSSTGLHMGVSIPFKGGDVDYLKLILFLGDEYVLQQYGREANSYTRSAMSELKQRGSNPRNAASAMELMKNNLIELAEREIVRSTGESKYTSAHKQGGKYIEFRSAGGDWLAEGYAEPGKLENTMMRYAYAMYLAGRPDLERKEYAKKLYKMIAPAGGDQSTALFTKFATGEIDKDQLKKAWAEKVLTQEPGAGAKKSRWKLYRRASGQPVPTQEFNGYTRDEAMSMAIQYASGGSQRDFDQAYELRDIGEDTNQWRVSRADTGETLEIINAENRNQAADQAYQKYTDVIPFKIQPYNPDEPDQPLSPRAKLAKRITAPKPDATVAMPQGTSADPGLTAGDWEFYRTETGNVIDRVDGINQMQANAVRADIVRRYGHPDQSVAMRRVDTTAPEADPAVAQNFEQPQS